MTIRIRLLLSLLLMALITVVAGGIGLWAMNYTLGEAAELIAGVDSRQQAALIGDFSRQVGTAVNIAMTTVTVLMIGATILAGVTAWMLARSIRRPTRALRKAMRQLKDGDYAARAEVLPGRNDELTALVTAFNDMAEALQTRHEATEDEQSASR